MSNPEEVRSVRLSAVITPTLNEKLERFAAARRWPKSSTVEYAIERLLDTEGGDTDGREESPR